ncbi:MAG: hypothetical protein ACPHSD_14850 [Candidatus Latescibacterota bacterium]
MGNADRSALEALSSRDTEILSQLVQRERSREALSHVRATGTKKTVYFDLDEGVLTALNDYCIAEQIKPAELIENLLLDRMRAPSPSALQAAFQELTRKMLVV